MSTGTPFMIFRDSLPRCLMIWRSRSNDRPLATVRIAASITSSTSFTRPGMAASGHCVQHWAHPVQLSGTNSGTSNRTSVMSRIVLVAAGMALSAANGSAMPSSPVLYR